MSLYDFDLSIITPQLVPPQLRQPKMMAWLAVLQNPLQYLRDAFFNTYIGGSADPAWTYGATFNKGDRTIALNKGVYQCKVNGTTGSIHQPEFDIVNWYKIQDLFIGIDERVMYNSQLIMLEYELNRYFQVPTSATKQCYIGNNAIAANGVFLMGNLSSDSSYMGNQFSDSFMGNAPTFSATATNFTVYIPAALFATLGTGTTNQTNAVRQFVDKYVLAGILYNVTSF